MTKILAFGALGQLGRELSEYPDVEALSRVEADLTKPEECIKFIENTDAKAVINAAAYTQVDRAEEEVALSELVNGKTVGLMAKACAKRGLPFVTISTDYVFSGEGDKPWTPEDKCKPINVYGVAKLHGERATIRAGGCYAIVRTSWVFSAHGRNFVKSILRLGKENATLDIIDDQIGGPTPAHDLALGCRKIALDLIDAPEKAGIYHLAGAPYTSWADFAKEIFRQSQTECTVHAIDTVDYPTTAQRPLNSRLDCSLTQKVFGLKEVRWQEGLKDVLIELGEYKLPI